MPEILTYNRFEKRSETDNNTNQKKFEPPLNSIIMDESKIPTFLGRKLKSKPSSQSQRVLG